MVPSEKKLLSSSSWRAARLVQVQGGLRHLRCGTQLAAPHSSPKGPSLRVRYQTIEFGEIDIHVRSLRDINEFEDVDDVADALGISSAMWPIFGQVWDAGRVLANVMLDYEVEGLKVLEVGCGIGLTSLLLNHRNADVTATDRHPSAEAFLVANTALNGGAVIPFERENWSDVTTQLGRFDVIVGSDLLYERDHAADLSAFIDRHAMETCEVILVEPGRGQIGRMTRCMTQLGYSHGRLTVEPASNPEGMQIHSYVRSEQG
jgi:predicted nicotinamide N-methyase